MKTIKNLLVLFFATIAFVSCEEEEVSFALQDVSAPSNINAIFDIAQDDTGLVSVSPTGDGVTSFDIYFGDVEEETPVQVAPGETVMHTYAEGEFILRIVATGLTGLTSELGRTIIMSFTPPSELDFEVVISPSNTFEVTVSPTAIDATMFDVYFGELEEEIPSTLLVGESATYTYEAVGDYTIRVVAKSASVKTIETSQDVTIELATTFTAEDLVGTWVMANQAGSLGVGPAIGDISWFAIDDQGLIDRACYFDDTYVFSTDGSFSNGLGTETWIEGWQGGSEACGTPVAPHDGSVNATYSVDGVASTLTIEGAGAYIGLPKAGNEGELPNVDLPESITYMVTLSEDKNTMNVVVETGTGSGVFWQYVLAKVDATSSFSIAGTWKVANEAGSFGVGPAIGDVSWFALDDQGIIDRACFIDDAYVFGADGSFMNVLGTETWIEGWQGGTEACGTPVAPHNGSNSATYVYDDTANTITLNGLGAYIALAKGTNTGELASPADAPASITYNVTVLDNDTMNVVIETGTGSGVFWQFTLVRDETTVSPIAGTWKVANEAGSFGVGPAIGDVSWFALDDQGIIDRACFIDDAYVFGADGSFMNVLGTETWIEGWQAGTEACGTPVAPHNGSNSATYVYDDTANTITLNGVGAYIALAKGTNTGELASPADAPASIIYNVTLSADSNSMDVVIETGTGSGVFWQFKLVKD